MSDEAEQRASHENAMREVLAAMLKGAAIQGSFMTGMNTNQLIPIFVEYVMFQMFLLAPMEVDEWAKLVIEQCKQPTVPMESLTRAREDLALTLEMVTNT